MDERNETSELNETDFMSDSSKTITIEKSKFQPNSPVNPPFQTPVLSRNTMVMNQSINVAQTPRPHPGSHNPHMIASMPNNNNNSGIAMHGMIPQMQMISPYGYSPQIPPQISYQPYQTPQPTTRIITEEVKYEIINEPFITYRCHWKACNEEFDSNELLETHCHQHTLESSNDRFICCWKQCKSTHIQLSKKNEMQTNKLPTGLLSSQQLSNHLKTHYPLRTVTMKEVRKPHKDVVVQVKPVEIETLPGIPLTALMLLRNLARCSKEEFEGCEGDLALIMAVDIRYSQYVGQILCELGDEVM